MRYGSVCSGIEAASVAWHPLSWQAAFLSEIEPFPRAVLAHHYPDVPLHGDFTTIQAGAYEPIDLLVGGTPCQSFSVAGLRGGLCDARGNLALGFLQLVGRLRPGWVVWENVPGVLSSNDGRDFGAILGGLVELGYGFAYRVLDAQYFGVPQRRRRVFVVGCLGDWRRAVAVLFERHSLSGHPAPRRETGQGVAPTIASRPTGGGGLGTDFDCDGGLIPDVANPLTARMHKGINTTCDEGQTMIAHSLRADGFDASEDGTGRGTPLVPVGTFQNTGHGWWNQSDVAQTLRGGSLEANVLAFSLLQGGRSMPVTEEAPTLEAGTGNKVPAIVFTNRGIETDGAAETLRSASHGALPMVSHAVVSNGDAHSAFRDEHGLVPHGMAVRRLTPRECERLQGFPDDYTLVSYRGKPAADGPRYKALGNSMAVPCMAWIGMRIQMVEAAA